MKEEKPFNPVLTPNITLPLTESPQPKVASIPSCESTTPSGARKARRLLNPKRTARRLTRKASGIKKSSWKKIKGGLQARLNHLKAVQLKRVLVACGIAASVAVIIIALAKHLALIVVLLAVLGLTVLIQVWNRIVTLGL